MICKVKIMSGAGNIFTAFDNRYVNLPIETFREKATLFCKLGDFITEGLFVINSGDGNLDFRAEFFNPDGSYGAMCGNGGRCAVRFALDAGMITNEDNKFRFLMAGTEYFAELQDSLISLFFPKPLIINEYKVILVGGSLIEGFYSDVGSDHFVIKHSEINLDPAEFYEKDIHEICSEIRYNSAFGLGGANVNVYLIIDGKVHLRTFERGVEAETGACGTGAVSTALTVALTEKMSFPIRIIPPSRKELIIDLIGEFPDKIENIILSGDAEILEETEVII